MSLRYVVTFSSPHSCVCAYTDTWVSGEKLMKYSVKLTYTGTGGDLDLCAYIIIALGAISSNRVALQYGLGTLP